MARPQRNTVDYFPFDCQEGKKMFYLEERYGNNGFAVFVKILRELAKTEYHYLDLSKKTTLMFLSAKCRVSIDLLESIINDLTELEKFDKKLWIENKIIWCQDFIESIKDAYLKRSNECITYEGLLQHLISLGIRKQSKSSSKGDVKPQTILDYTKEKKSKDVIDQIIDLFSETYFINFEIDYKITNKGKERGCAGKILKYYKEKYPEADTEETMNGLNAYFDACCKINDTWLSNNMSLCIIVNKFNEINKILKNGNKTKSGASDRELAEMFANKFGSNRQQ